MTDPFHISNQKFENSMDLVIISDKIRSHYVHIKDFNKFIFNKTKTENNKYFCKYCLKCFSSEKILVEHKEICLKINGKQIVKLKSGFIEFKNYTRQIPAPFKVFADFQCILESVKNNKKESGSYTEKYKDHIPCSFAYKLVCVDNKFSKPVVPYRGDNAAYNFIKMMLEEFGYCKKVMKKHFKKNLIKTEEEEEEIFN